MTALPNDNRLCGICGKSCRVRLDDLFDGRFGAPPAPLPWWSVPTAVWSRPGPGPGPVNSKSYTSSSLTPGSNRRAPTGASGTGLTLTARALVLPWFRHLKRSLTGDCLIVTARDQEG